MFERRGQPLTRAVPADIGLAGNQPQGGQHRTERRRLLEQEQGVVARQDVGDREQAIKVSGETDHYSRHAEWMAAMPPDRFRTFTISRPAASIRCASCCWSGNLRMLSTRYW